MKKNFEIVNRWKTNKYYNSVLIVENLRYNVKQYFLVSMDIDTKTLKPKNNPIFTYEIKRYAEDNICNYTSRPLDYISEEALKEAEKTLIKNLKELKKIVKKIAPQHVAWAKIENHVKKIVKNYHSDFYFHDSLFMAENPESPFILSIGENGTHIFISCDDISSFEYVYKNYPNSKFLFFDGENLQEEINPKNIFYKLPKR